MTGVQRLDLDLARAALIIMDLQNDAITIGGKFAATGSSDHAASQNILANVGRLAGAARAAGIPVIHVHFVVEEGARGLKLNAPIFEGIKTEGALVRGSWGAAPAPGMEPQPGDLVVEKTRMNAFYETRLDALLRAFEVDTIVISGAWTNVSIEHTARHGADAGYAVIVVEDATSTLNDEWQQAALSYTLTNVGRILRVDDLVAAMARPR